VLAGLLRSQAVRVAAAYRRHGLVPMAGARGQAEWPCLVLTRRPSQGRPQVLWKGA
jgi:ribosomal protein L11 methyltransferase